MLTKDKTIVHGDILIDDKPLIKGLDEPREGSTVIFIKAFIKLILKDKSYLKRGYVTINISGESSTNYHLSFINCRIPLSQMVPLFVYGGAQ